MTDNDIFQALIGKINLCKELNAWGTEISLTQLKDIRDLIDRKNAEIKRLKKELEETQEKLEALLCEATGGKLSKHSYTAEVMTTQAHEHLLKCCAEEIKEFAEMLKEYLDDFYHTEEDGLLDTAELIDNLVKERVGES